MARRTPPRPRIVAVLHQEGSSPGRVGTILGAMGYDIDVRRPFLGEALPETLADHAGAIVFGGPMSANDGDDWISREIDWIGVPLAEGKPFLGICLGAQMLAHHLGAQVKRNGEGVSEIGYFPIRPTQAGAALMEWPSMAYQWHSEGFALPAGATLLAQGEDAFPNQAMQFGVNAFGVQFHPELTFAQLHLWTVLGASIIEELKAQPPRLQLEGRFLHDRQIRTWLENFLALWLTPAQG